MLRFLTLLLCCLASVSALVAQPRVPLLAQQSAAGRMAASPLTMAEQVVRVEIELEDGEP